MDDIFEHKIPDTSEAVTKRIGASLIDYLIFAVVLALCIIIFGHKIAENVYRVTGPPAAIPIVFWVFYFIVLEFYLQGSFGKKILKLRIVSVNGEKATFFQIVLRRICDLFDILCCFGLVGILLMRKTKKNQRLGDIWAKTIVLIHE